MKICPISFNKFNSINYTANAVENNKKIKEPLTFDNTEISTLLDEAEMDSMMLYEIYMQTGSEADYERYISSIIFANDLRKQL